MYLHIVGILIGSWVLLWLGAEARTLLQKTRRGMEATVAYCEAHCAFSEWVFEHPGVYIGSCPQGRRLVEQYIKTYNRFLDVHQFDRNDPEYAEHLEYLQSLLI